MALPESNSSVDGLHLGMLVLGSEEWIHRRVERFVIEPTGECTRYVSMDFTVPDWAHISASPGRILVPLGLLRKGPLSAFSATGALGEVIPVLETAANSKLSQLLLNSIARHVVRSTDFDWDRFDDLVAKIVAGIDVVASEAVGKARQVLMDSASEVEERSLLTALIAQFADNFLLVVELGDAAVGHRSVAKYTYREARAGSELKSPRPEIDFDLPEFGIASSTHFEFSPPPLLVVTSATMSQIGTTQKVVTSSAGQTATCHLVARPEHRFVRATVTVALAPRAYGATSASWAGAFALAMVLALVVFVRWLRGIGVLPDARVGSGAVAVVLAAAGLLMTWIARAPEDWTTSQILLSARRSLLWSAVLAVAVAVLLSVAMEPPARDLVWLAAWAAACVNFVHTAQLRRQNAN